MTAEAVTPVVLPRTKEEIQKDYEAAALLLGDKSYRKAVLEKEIPDIQQRMYALNMERCKLEASNVA